jgi:hypothetical protein
MTRRAITSAAIGTAVLFVTQLARADDGDAEAQFKYGLAEMLAGRYATGCPALETSYRLDPRAGTLFTLAECDRKAGKAATALAEYDQYLALYAGMTAEQRAAQKERAAVAAEERAALQSAVPIQIVEPPPPQAAVDRPATPAQKAEPRADAVAGRAGRSRRTWTYAIGGVGVAGLAVAATTGALAMAKRSTASADCSTSGVCTSQQGVDSGNSARSLANVATAGCLVGGIALAAAIILWLTEPSAPPRSVAGLSGTW